MNKLVKQVAAGRRPNVTGLYRVHRVKRALIAMQHGKCAFCESYVSHRFEGDVDHFRPKAAWRQNKNDPLSSSGYWWLAYEWTNLFFTCEFCNRRFKENLFPIQGTRAVKPNDSLQNEQALLIDPVSEEPSLFLRFRDEVAYAVSGSNKGGATIRTFGLNERGHPKGLIELRAEMLGDFREDLKLFDDLRALWATLPTTTQSRTRDLQTRLLDRKSPDRPYSAMFRDAIEEHDRAAPPLAAPL